MDKDCILHIAWLHVGFRWQKFPQVFRRTKMEHLEEKGQTKSEWRNRNQKCVVVLGENVYNEQLDQELNWYFLHELLWKPCQRTWIKVAVDQEESWLSSFSVTLFIYIKILHLLLYSIFCDLSSMFYIFYRILYSIWFS